MRQDPKPVSRQTGPQPGFARETRRLHHRLVRKAECTPVRSDHDASASGIIELLKRGHADLGRHVNRLHEPAWLVGAYRKNGHVERTEPLRYLAEFRMKSRVSREVDPGIVVEPDGPSAPQRRVSVPWVASGEMLGRRTSNAHLRSVMVFPPVELIHVTGSAIPQEASNAKRRKPSHTGKTLDQPTHRRIVEMVVVIMGDESDINRREIVETHRRRHQPARARKCNRRYAVGPYRIGEDVHPATLQQK